MDDGSSDTGEVAAFVGDPAKAAMMANRADVAQMIATIGLALTSQMDATGKMLDGDRDEAMKSLEATRRQMLTLVEEFRDFIGKAGDAG